MRDMENRMQAAESRADEAEEKVGSTGYWLGVGQEGRMRRKLGTG